MTADASPAGAGPLRERLSRLPPESRRGALLALVRSEVRDVLGAEAVAVAAGRAFQQLGFDSVRAVALRDRLRRATGLALPASLAFDHPTPLAVAERLHAELFPEEEPVPCDEFDAMDADELVRRALGDGA